MRKGLITGQVNLSQKNKNKDIELNTKIIGFHMVIGGGMRRFLSEYYMFQDLSH